MGIFLVTSRLSLRRFTESDVDNLVALDSDPGVMRFLGDGRPTPRERVEHEILPRILGDYQRFAGHGQWAAIETSTSDFVGWFSLRPREDRPASEAELGYRLRRGAWGRGFATEGSTALIHRGFAELGLRRVFAETMAVNLASRRVLEKAGLRLVRTFHETWEVPLPGAEHGEVEYALDRQEWLQAGE